jgi:two-component system, NarL family, nitrate/nitrite response regulator NarL
VDEADPNSHQMTVMVISRHALTRESIKLALEGRRSAAVVGEAATLSECLSAERPRAEVWIIDVSGSSDVATLHSLRELDPEARLIIVSEEEDPELLFDVVHAGVHAYITMAEGMDELLQTVERVSKGETVIPGKLLGPLLRQLAMHKREHDEALAKLDSLTKREREVLRLLSQGAGNSEIADELFISPETARTHIHNLLTKLGMHSRLEAASFVITNDLLMELST